MKRIFFVVPVVIFFALAGLLYAGLNSGPPTYIPSGMVGKPAPAVALPAMDAQAVSFDRAELAAGQPTIDPAEISGISRAAKAAWASDRLPAVSMARQASSMTTAAKPQRTASSAE